MTLSASQERIFNNIEKDGPISQWQNWRWQVRHSVKDVNTFEKLLGVELGEKVRNEKNHYPFALISFVIISIIALLLKTLPFKLISVVLFTFLLWYYDSRKNG